MKPFELSAEQEFNIKAFEVQARGLSKDQAHDALVECYRSIVMKEMLYKSFLMRQLGVEKP
jgi:hypothetical protein